VWTLTFYLLDNISHLRTEALDQAAPSLVQQAIGLARPNSGTSASLQKIIIEVRYFQKTLSFFTACVFNRFSIVGPGAPSRFAVQGAFRQSFQASYSSVS